MRSSDDVDAAAHVEQAMQPRRAQVDRDPAEGKRIVQALEHLRHSPDSGSASSIKSFDSLPAEA